MNWNGVISTVGSVLNTALPLLLSVVADEKGTAADAVVPVGPATLYKNTDGELVVANYNLEAASADSSAPVMVTLSSAEGVTQTNFSAELPFGESFLAGEWLERYSDGSVTAGISPEFPAPAAGRLPEGVWSIALNTALTVKDVITTLVNSKLSLQLELKADEGFVLVTAIGAAAVLGTTYMLTARNNAGLNGARTGLLRKVSSDAGADNAQFIIDLPEGVDYDDGMYELYLQLAVMLTPGGTSTDPDLVFITIPQADRDRIAAARTVPLTPAASAK